MLKGLLKEIRNQLVCKYEYGEENVYILKDVDTCFWIWQY